MPGPLAMSRLRFVVPCVSVPAPVTQTARAHVKKTLQTPVLAVGRAAPFHRLLLLCPVLRGLWR